MVADNNKKNALITGSTRGLGLSYAYYLADKGYNIIIHDLSDQACKVYGEAKSVDEILMKLNKKGSSSKFYECDLTDSNDVNDFVSRILKDYNDIDVLINNAGGDIKGDDKMAAGGKASFNNFFLAERDFSTIYNRNFLSTLNMCRTVGSLMKKRQKGKILNISSVSGGFGVEKESAYALAKASIIHLTRCLATELRPYGINVNCIAPGATRTGRFLSTIKERTNQDLERLDCSGPLERLGEPEDVCKVVEFFVSGQSDFVSGQILRVDGGQFTSPI